MASNFEIAIDKKGYDFILKLEGDFDVTSAYELIYAIKKLVTFKSCGTGSSRHRTELFYDLDPAPMRAGFPGGF